MRNFFLKIVLFCIVIMFLTSFSMVVMDIRGNQNALNQISKAHYQLLDDNAKKQEKTIFVTSVNNKILKGKLYDNKNIEFGVKNILEEYLLDNGWSINPNASKKLYVDIIYMDVLKTNANFSILHKNKEEVYVRLAGYVVVDSVKSKPIMGDASSFEVSMSTLVVDNGGKFNQKSLTNAIKKASEMLVKKIEN